ncbi:MAG: 4Fe-4S binding protein [Coprobacillus sp.]
MKITHIRKLVFSPTGSTQKVVDIVSDVWKQPKEEIDLSNPDIDFSQYCFTSHDLCFVAVPSYGGRVPEIAVKHLKMIRSMNSPVILIATYGNRAYDDTLLELKEVMKAQGFLCVSAISAVCEHSIMRQFGMGRPDKLDIMQLTEFATNIRDILDKVADMEEVGVPGNYPYREYNGVPLKPKASRKCVECGLCAKQCPVKAIDINNPKKTDEKKCISCMRCIKVCPQNARKCNSLILVAATKKMMKACAGSKPNQLFVGKLEDKA